MSYRLSYGDLVRRSAGYVDKIFKGPSRLTYQWSSPTKFELLVNLNTVKAPGITIRESILLRADEVIK